MEHLWKIDGQLMKIDGNWWKLMEINGTFDGNLMEIWWKFDGKIMKIDENWWTNDG